jgi:hypothetical protein
MNLDKMSTMHFITGAWKLITLNNYFFKCAFPVDHIYSNDDKELNLTENDKNVLHGFQSLGAQFEEYTPIKVLLRFIKSTVLIKHLTNVD